MPINIYVETHHVRALKNADSICFDHLPNGDGQIRAIRRAENSSTGFEETVTVPVNHSLVANYGEGDGPWHCFAMLMSARYDNVAQTLVRHIKTGSVIGLAWTRDNSSPVTKEAGIYVDMLDVSVSTPSGKVVDTFRVSTYIGYDNSARMTRKATPNMLATLDN